MISAKRVGSGVSVKISYNEITDMMNELSDWMEDDAKQRGLAND